MDGTCDLIINIGPLSESQAAPLVRQAAAFSSLQETCTGRVFMVHVLAALYVLGLSRCLRGLHACRDQNRTIMQIPFAVGSARLVHSWRPWGEPPGCPIVTSNNAEPQCFEYFELCAPDALPDGLNPVCLHTSAINPEALLRCNNFAAMPVHLGKHADAQACLLQVELASAYT